jgi:hypothetical protein
MFSRRNTRGGWPTRGGKPWIADRCFARRPARGSGSQSLELFETSQFDLPFLVHKQISSAQEGLSSNLNGRRTYACRRSLISALGRKAVVPLVHAKSGHELRNTTAEADFMHVVPAGVAGDAAGIFAEWGFTASTARGVRTLNHIVCKAAKLPIPSRNFLINAVSMK